MSTWSATRKARLLVVGVAAAALGLMPMATGRSAESTSTVFPVQLVTVDTPSRADKAALQALGLDLTEHAGHDFVEVVLHSALDLETLRASGLGFDVRIPDLVLREAQNNELNKAYSAATLTSPLPSGRDSYRRLADYNADLDMLATEHPAIVKKVELNHRSLEGKAVYGVEIGANVAAAGDGRPVFLIMGLHHAREWPSGEHVIEFAFDLVENYGVDPRITDLLKRARVIAVPVVNVDGFEKSVDDGLLLDLREVDGGGTASVLATPGNAYKRKNCRMVDGQEPLVGECAQPVTPGGFGLGVDLNRNYAGFWGGPGASGTSPDPNTDRPAGLADPTYRGAAPFSEPETQNIRELISSRQVTMLITNHTFSNLVLRPNGVAPHTIGPDGQPVGDAPDEAGLAALGAKMAAQNGYASQHGWQLYDTTGTTEDWSYNATGGYGYTFEIGSDEFHPPYPKVVDEYLGAGAFVGKGNREAYLIALEHAVDTTAHGILTGKAPAGATLRLTKTFETPTWSDTVSDTLDSTMVVGAKGTYSWHVNPSTRPIVAEKQRQVLDSEPKSTQTFSGSVPSLTASGDTEFTVPEDADLMAVNVDWATPDDLDVTVYRKEADGSLTKVGESANSVAEKEQVLVPNATAGAYVLRVTNYASVALTWDATVSLFDGTTESIGGLVESWTLTCEKSGTILETRQVTISRGQQLKVDLRACSRLFHN